MWSKIICDMHNLFVFVPPSAELSPSRGCERHRIPMPPAPSADSPAESEAVLLLEHDSHGGNPKRCT